MATRVARAPAPVEARQEELPRPAPVAAVPQGPAQERTVLEPLDDPAYSVPQDSAVYSEYVDAGPSFWGDDPNAGAYSQGTPADGGYGCGPVHAAGCGPLWLRGDYLFWWTKGYHVPPLVTTSTDPADGGILGEPTTSILFGDEEIDFGSRSGGRFWIGYSFDPCRTRGVEIGYFFLGEGSTSFHAASDNDGEPVLARPFFDTELLEQNAEPISFPDMWAGEVDVSATNRLQGLEALYRRCLTEACASRLDFLVGYRYLNLEEGLRIAEDLEVIGPGTPYALGTTVEVFDQFDTANTFHGAELGIVARSHFDGWSLEMLMKLALGSAHSEVFIDGQTTATYQGTSATHDGGILALDSNRGTHSIDQFAVVPELGITLGYELTCRLRATFGYTFLYWSQVARPGDHIDLDVNPLQIPPAQQGGVPRPEFRWVTDDFWAQGMNFGLEYCF
ncbi:MAG TPA: BBP7 family outer membrane beta-barrel protein [Thermoguttaceae bacterium]|nr:BBP7 family outer membrane beta-barrel protein [Thermoguttaceae bacterium]